MKKYTFILLFVFLDLIAFSQNNKYSIYVSFAKKRKAKKYEIYLLNNDSVYTVKPYEFCRFNYENNNLKLIVKQSNKPIFEMDSIEKFYIDNYNTVYLDIHLNKDAYVNSVSGLFIKSDYLTEDDFFCYNCIDDKNHSVIVSSSEGEFVFKKRRRCFLKRLFGK